MQSNKTYYLTVGANDIPWNRIIHWYGRATNFPKLFDDILSDDKNKQSQALHEIEKNIEHQDGIIMATPFTLIFLLRLLSLTANKEAILKIVLRIMKASEFQLQFCREQKNNLPIYSIQQLLREEYLWPIFESEEQDEINWEEYIINNEYYSWLLHIFDIVRSFSGILEELHSNKLHTTTVEKILFISSNSKTLA